MITIRDLFLRHNAQTSPEPNGIHAEKAEGMFIYDTDGKKYYDLVSGFSVSNIGHCHPKVVEAVKKQAETYMHVNVYGEFIQTPQTKAAEKLCSLLPDSLNNVYFTNSGSESIEGAMKLAKRYTGRSKIFSFKNAYHGSTQGSASLMDSEYFTAAYRPLLPDIYHLDFNNIEQLSQIDENTAAVVLEVTQAEAGVFKAHPEFIESLKNRCKETGTLIIADEIQTGFGRTGTFFNFQQYDFVPDILCLAKALGGGMPIGAFVANQQLMQSLSINPVLGHITTFGGHPVSCAAALANMEILEQENYIDQVDEKSQLFESLLINHPKVKCIRRSGFLIAIELESDKAREDFVRMAHEEGMHIDWFLFFESAFRLAPPLIITRDEIKDICQLIIKCLDKI